MFVVNIFQRIKKISNAVKNMCITIEKVGNLTENVINSAQKVRNCLKVCRKYLYLYPEMIASEIYTYKDMYEEEDASTCADYAQVGNVGKIQCDMGIRERNAND